jgi:hypothetical protein
MKKILIFLLLLFCCLAYSEEISNGVVQKPVENEYFLSPTLGWGPVGATASLDFMWRLHNGFAMLINFNLAIPFTPKGGIFPFSELYFGYSLKRGNFYATFAGGLMLGGGLGFYRYEKWVYPGYIGVGSSPVSIFAMALFAVRNDYTYFFNEKVGIIASHTHGVGFNGFRWILDDKKLYLYNFLLKIGATFRI